MDRDLDALEMALISFMQAVFRPKSWITIQQLAGVTIDRPCASLLMALHSGKQSCPLRELAEKMGVEAPSVTRTVQRLERDGLIARQTDPHDHRITNAQLSAKGLAVVEAIRHAKRERLRGYLHEWTAKDRKELIRLLDRLAQAAQK